MHQCAVSVHREPEVSFTLELSRLKTYTLGQFQFRKYILKLTVNMIVFVTYTLGQLQRLRIIEYVRF